jgi:hypothetical protein
MLFRFGSKEGDRLPSHQQALQEIQTLLLQHQQSWAQKLAEDPACFATLEHEIHRCFGQLADRLTASLVATTAEQPALGEAAQKK